MTEHDTRDVLVVGAGVAGMAAAIFTARHNLDTLVADGGDPLLRRNAHLENYPGFPAGVNSRLLLDMMHDQAQRAGSEFTETAIVALERDGEGFVAEGEAGEFIHATSVIAATKNTVEYLEPIEGVEILDRGKTFVETDRRGRTGATGLYAAGRLAREPHQTIVAAGHGAKVAVTLLEDIDEPFYHDWVAPDRYFTGRDRDVPPGCEEIDEAERKRRERASLEVLQDYIAEPHPDQPQQHPSVAIEDD